MVGHYGNSRIAAIAQKSDSGMCLLQFTRPKVSERRSVCSLVIGCFLEIVFVLHCIALRQRKGIQILNQKFTQYPAIHTNYIISSAGSKTRGARSKLVGMGPPPINLLFHEFLTSPLRRFLGRVDVLNHFEPALSVCCPLWAYLVLFQAKI